MSSNHWLAQKLDEEYRREQVRRAEAMREVQLIQKKARTERIARLWMLAHALLDWAVPQRTEKLAKARTLLHQQ